LYELCEGGAAVAPWLSKQTDPVAAVKLLTADSDWPSVLGSGITAKGGMDAVFRALCSFLRIVPATSRGEEERGFANAANHVFAKAGCKAVILSLTALETKIQEGDIVPQMVWDASATAILEVNKTSEYEVRPKKQIHRESCLGGGSSDLDEDTLLAYANTLLADGSKLTPKVTQEFVAVALRVSKGQWSEYLNGKLPYPRKIESALQNLMDMGDDGKKDFLRQAKELRQAHDQQKKQQKLQNKRKSEAANTMQPNTQKKSKSKSKSRQ
jgi:hypothetical protein